MLWPTYLLGFGLSFTWNIYTLFIPLFLLQSGFSGWQMGILISISTLTALLFTFPVGKATDEVSANKVLAVGLILIAVFLFGISKASAFFVLLPLFLVGGLGRNICKISLSSLILKKAKNPHRPKKLAIYQFLGSFGSAIGLLLGGWLLTRLGFDEIFVMCTALVLILAVMAFRLKGTKVIHTTLKGYKLDFFRKEVVILALIFFLYAIHWGAESTSYTPFLKEYFHLSTSMTGLYISIPIMFLAIVAFFTGDKLDKHLSARKALYLGLFLSAIGHILMTVPHLGVSFLFRIIHEIGDGIMLVLVLVDISKLFPLKRIGGDAGIITVVTIMGSFTGSLIFGPLGFFMGFAWPLIISGLIILVSLALSLIFRRYLAD